MQHVNDDMDELFRRAAEGYPLNTNSADWNAVSKKLASEKSVEDIPSAKDKNYKHLLWLLLLLPLGWVFNTYVFNKNDKSATALLKDSTNKNISNTSLSKNIIPTHIAVKPATLFPKNSLALINSSGMQRKGRGKLNSNISENRSTFIPDYPLAQSEPAIELSNKNESEIIPGTNNKTDIIKNIKDPATNNDKQAEDNAGANKDVITTKDPHIKIRKQKEHGLYAGIIVSPDISTVKFQSVKKIGVSMGILIGYQLSRKMSIESGVSWNIKNYYSEGKYFSIKNIRVPLGAQIKDVNGICNMIEVPVLVKYNLTTGKTNFSTSAGVSAYIMKKESYDYEIERNGQQYPYHSSYKNTSTDLLAVANFAIGYNQQIKKSITLHIEPYIKVPLKGIGIGSLPIMSSGLNIAITKKLSR